MSSRSTAVSAQTLVDAEFSKDRVIKSLSPPPYHPFPHDKLFNPKNGNLPTAEDLHDLQNHFFLEGTLTLKDAFELITRATLIFRNEPNIFYLNDPIVVVGDIHGQYYDLIKMFEVGGSPENTQYLFLGDYVDRGCFSLEVIFYLFALKISHPSTLYMLRGNHECRQLTSFFNFKDECIYKYNLDLYDAMMTSFDCLPLAAIINDKFFCVHAGLSPELKTINDIVTLDRFHEIPRSTLICDLVWSDPIEAGDSKPNFNDEDGTDSEDDMPAQPVTLLFAHNKIRKCSYVYGTKAVDNFLTANNLTSVIRGHEAQPEGYKMHMAHEETKIPRVITIFSAPNYCDHDKNKAAILEFDNNLLNIRQYIHSEHPYYLPNFMNVFDWSLPFVIEKIVVALTQLVADPSDDDSSDDFFSRPISTVLAIRGKSLKFKILILARIVRFLKLLHEEEANIAKIKQGGKSLPIGLLSQGREAIMALSRR